MIVIYLGDVTEYLAIIARTQDPNACLITEPCNGNLQPGTYYTSIGDLGGLVNLGKVLQQADKIIYAPPPTQNWSGGQSMKDWTEDYLKIFSFRCLVENYNHPMYFNQSITFLADNRKTDQNQIWIAGCSISHGVGVNQSDCYGAILSKRLGMPVSFLTCPGSSIYWAADQILRSDIQAGDIVVWGLTSDQRMAVFDHNKITHVYPTRYVTDGNLEKSMPLSTLTGQHVFYQNCLAVFQVINFCKVAKAKLVIASLMHNEVIEYFRNYSNLVVLSHLWGRDAEDLFGDLGYDLVHPGPKTHSFYAHHIFEKLKEIS